MFLAIEKSGLEESFKKRDDLLYFLDVENAKCLKFGQKKVFTLQQLNADERVVDLTNIRMPYDASLDTLLRDFGKKNEAKAEVLLDATPDMVSDEKDKPGHVTPEDTSSPVAVKQSPKALIALGLVNFLLLAGVAGLGYMSNQGIKEELMKLKTELKEVKEVNQETHQADVFTRYFLPNYYSGEQENLSDYLMKGHSVAVQKGQVLSVILEESKKVKDELVMTYVLVVKTDVGQENIRLTIPLKEVAEAKYGYLVSGHLTKEDFPK